MAAPSTGQPVVITVGSVWRFHLNPPSPRPPRLSVAVTVGWIVLALRGGSSAGAPQGLQSLSAVFSMPVYLRLDPGR
ncbi:uncharacterized protein [Trachinotus anak]|uniref:uncharacterized protein isoform X2 n=1 Tax=Trachinotus anak TaxID=443729 RepID=UPI0039F1FF03